MGNEPTMINKNLVLSLSLSSSLWVVSFLLLSSFHFLWAASACLNVWRFWPSCDGFKRWEIEFHSFLLLTNRVNITSPQQNMPGRKLFERRRRRRRRTVSPVVPPLSPSIFCIFRRKRSKKDVKIQTKNFLQDLLAFLQEKHTKSQKQNQKMNPPPPIKTCF